MASNRIERQYKPVAPVGNQVTDVADDRAHKCCGYHVCSCKVQQCPGCGIQHHPRWACDADTYDRYQESLKHRQVVNPITRGTTELVPELTNSVAVNTVLAAGRPSISIILGYDIVPTDYSGLPRSEQKYLCARQWVTDGKHLYCGVDLYRDLSARK